MFLEVSFSSKSSFDERQSLSLSLVLSSVVLVLRSCGSPALCSRLVEVLLVKIIPHKSAETRISEIADGCERRHVQEDER